MVLCCAVLCCGGGDGMLWFGMLWCGYAVVVVMMVMAD